MRPFTYARADDAAAAASAMPPAPAAVAGMEPVQYLAGGTNIVDHMKLDVMHPAWLVDINALEATYGRIDASARGLRLGALVRMSDAETHAAVRRDYPVTAQSLQQAASARLTNMASLGGNVPPADAVQLFPGHRLPRLQQARARFGLLGARWVNRQHALFGTSDACIATYPGDFAQGLVVLGATVELLGRDGAWSIHFEDLHRAYGDMPHVETTLRPGELITGFFVRPAPWFRRSLYLEVRDRRSYAYALTSAAVALDLSGGTVREARIALGGVASRPWRAHAAEAACKGQRLTEASATEAARAAFADARPHGKMRSRSSWASEPRSARCSRRWR